eukprot:360262-Chlamydomonas_euryale.AAC.12
MRQAHACDNAPSSEPGRPSAQQWAGLARCFCCSHAVPRRRARRPAAARPADPCRSGSPAAGLGCQAPALTSTSQGPAAAAQRSMPTPRARPPDQGCGSTRTRAGPRPFGRRRRRPARRRRRPSRCRKAAG